MKHPVSLVACLVLASAMAAACSAQAGEAEFSQVCMEKMGGSQAKCACYVKSVLAELTPDKFNKFAQGVVDNRRFAGLMTEALENDQAISAAASNATKTCFA